MKTTHTRREFLADVGRGMLVATVGYSVATDLGFAPALAAEASDTLDFGRLEPLVRLMQETPANKLLPALISRLNAGADLKQLVAAGLRIVSVEAFDMFPRTHHFETLVWLEAAAPQITA